jgi:hypothetical protein
MVESGDLRNLQIDGGGLGIDAPSGQTLRLVFSRPLYFALTAWAIDT